MLGGDSWVVRVKSRVMIWIDFDEVNRSFC